MLRRSGKVAGAPVLASDRLNGGCDFGESDTWGIYNDEKKKIKCILLLNGFIHVHYDRII